VGGTRIDASRDPSRASVHGRWLTIVNRPFRGGQVTRSSRSP